MSKPTLTPDAFRITPTRDAVTGRTVCYVQPGEADQVDLFTATGIYIGSASAADWQQHFPPPATPPPPAAQPPTAAS